MEKQFIPYEQALKLKELGFDEPVFGLYAPKIKTVFLHHYGVVTAKEQVPAPLWQQAFDWLVSKITNELYVEDFMIAHLNEYSSKKDAQFACLNKLIEIVGQQKQIK